MKIFKTDKIIKLVLSSVLLFPGVIFNQATTLDQNGWLHSGVSVAAAEKPAKKTRKTPAMRERIYSQLARAQKLADDNKVTEGLAVLDRVKTRINQLNSYEKAMLWNFYGFIYYGKSDTPMAIEAFEKVVSQNNIPESLELSTLFSLAQLSMTIEEYQQAIDYLNRWGHVKKSSLDNSGLVLKANAYYSMKDYSRAEKSISKAVDTTIKQGKLPRENWLVLKRALHYELKHSEKMVEVSEQLVRHYSKPKYWIELASLYGELDKTDKQLAVMEAAYQQGFVTKRMDVQTLAQLYFLNGAPYKSAKLLSESIESGLVLENMKILNYLAQAWTSAKEYKKAVPVLIRAANLSKSGNLDAKLAETYIALEQWDNAIESSQVAKKKGHLDHLGNVNMVIGIAYFNKQKFSLAIDSFEEASNDKKQKKIAEQWLRYAEKEQYKYQQLKQGSTDVGH